MVILAQTEQLIVRLTPDELARSASELIKSGDYNWMHIGIDPRIIPPIDHNQGVSVRTVLLDEPVTNTELVKRFPACVRPITPLVIGCKIPSLQRSCSMITVWKGYRRFYYINLRGNRNGRYLEIDWLPPSCKWYPGVVLLNQYNG